MKQLISLCLIILPLFLCAQNKTCPCCTEKHRQFDFWIGEWEVFKTGTDTLLGTNKILVMQDSCVLQENWTSANPAYSGTSYNFYDSQEQQWRQIWVDNQATNLKLFGKYNGKAMVMRSELLPAPNGGTMINRITWTPNEKGDVRQHWEVSGDNGKNWQTAFDGMYKKKTD